MEVQAEQKILIKTSPRPRSRCRLDDVIRTIIVEPHCHNQQGNNSLNVTRSGGFAVLEPIICDRGKRITTCHCNHDILVGPIEVNNGYSEPGALDLCDLRWPSGAMLVSQCGLALGVAVTDSTMPLTDRRQQPSRLS